MKVDIDPLVTPAIWGLTDTAPTLEIYANQPFETSDGQSVLVGSFQAQDFRRRVVGSVVNGVATFPSIADIDSTEDSPTNQLATYSAYIRVQGQDPIPYLENFPLAPLPTGKTSWSWTEVRIHATNLVARRTFEVYTKQQTEALIALAVAGIDVGGTDLGWFNVRDHGLVGDGVTDDTAALQALINAITALAIDATIFFPRGIYIIAGALQDVALSNSQIVLPKINKSTPMRTLRFLGESPAAQAWPSNTGSVLRSTLAAGTGFMIGVRSNWGSGTSTYIEEAQNNMTFLTFVRENLIFETVANPTISALNDSFIHRPVARHCRIAAAGVTTGPGAVSPDLFAVEPTTPGSYGLLTPIDGIPSIAIYEDVTIEGFFTAVRWGELISANNITIGACKVGLEVRGGSHISVAQKLLFVSTGVLMKTVGRDPLFTNLGAPNENHIDIQQFDYENNSGLIAWANTTAHIDDPNNYLHGDVKWSSTVFAFVMNGGKNLVPHQSNKPWHTRRPFTAITGADLDASFHAVDETTRGLPTSDNTHVAWKVLTTFQSGINHLVGILAFVNGALGAAVDKRLAQINGRTDGATNHGALDFYTMNGGVLSLRAWFDRLGNFNLTGLMPRGEGPVLASGAAIAPTFPVHVVSGVAAITDITVPNIPAGAAVTIALIPSGAWTWTNAGNIGGPGGTAVVGRTLFITWVPSLAKWATSYV